MPRPTLVSVLKLAREGRTIRVGLEFFDATSLRDSIAQQLRNFAKDDTTGLLTGARIECPPNRSYLIVELARPCGDERNLDALLGVLAKNWGFHITFQGLIDLDLDQAPDTDILHALRLFGSQPPPSSN
jgi:hypothetical protein